jgi:hypothetical protein
MKSKKIIPASTLVIFSICLLGILFAVFERNIYKWWGKLVVHKPHIFQVDSSRRTVIQVNPNSEGIDWLGTTWTDDGKYIKITNSRGQVYASKLMVIDPQKAVYAHDIQTLESGNILGLINELPFTLEYRESLWAGCQKENLFFTAKYLDSKPGFWEARLWKGSQLIKTFPPVEIRFGIYQSGFRDEPIGWTIEYSNFSPDCRYFTINSSNTTWILDTVNRSFTPLMVNKRQLISERIFSLLDVSCNQCVWPIWSPNSHEFVFNSGNGIEKYDILSNKRSWLVAPYSNTGAGEWSKTGKWILGSSSEKMSVISSDGYKIGTLEGCENIEHPSWSSKDIHTYLENPSWSPTDDKFAFICNQYDQSTCTDGKCEKEERFLIIWDLSNLDSN